VYSANRVRQVCRNVYSENAATLEDSIKTHSPLATARLISINATIRGASGMVRRAFSALPNGTWGATSRTWFPPQPETLVRPEATVKQDGGNISQQQERVCGFSRVPPTHGRPDSFQRAQMCLLVCFTDGGGALQIAFLFVCGPKRGLGDFRQGASPLSEAPW